MSQHSLEQEQTAAPVDLYLNSQIHLADRAFLVEQSFALYPPLLVDRSEFHQL